MSLPSDRDGARIDFSDYQGKYLIVHVFTTWSLPAKDDALRLVEAFGDAPGVAIVGVALDLRGALVAAPWRRGMGVRYPIALADELTRSGASVLGSTRAVPFTLLFDRDGRRLWRWDRPLEDAGIAEIRARTREP